MQQARYWLLTIPHYAYTPYLPPKCTFIAGQLERGQGDLPIGHPEQQRVCLESRERPVQPRILDLDVYGPDEDLQLSERVLGRQREGDRHLEYPLFDQAVVGDLGLDYCTPSQTGELGSYNGASLVYPYNDNNPHNEGCLDRTTTDVQEPRRLSLGLDDDFTLDDILSSPTRTSNNNEQGFLHWQLLVHFSNKVRLRTVREVFGPYHAEPSRSEAARHYVWKEATSIPGTRFALGKLPVRRGNTNDWDAILEATRLGAFDEIPSDVLIRYYGNLCRIRTDSLQPSAIEKQVYCFWGPTGTGKSRRAWNEAGLEAYPKDPRTKFWDGYRSQEHVVIDEFRGCIDVAHLLRWFDRYPVCVEVKGSSVILSARKIWITSNLRPNDWYPTLDELTLKALLRRLTIINMPL